MNTPTATRTLRQTEIFDLEPLRLPTGRRAQAGRPRTRQRPAFAAHDFLVPNPRPDLSTDPATLRMIEVW